MAGIECLVIHHTTGPNSLTAESIAAYQVGQSSPVPYPEIAYHALVLEDGTINICHSVYALTWHCGTGSDYTQIDDSGYRVGGNNWESYGIAFAGTDPTAAQVASMRWLADELEMTWARKLKRLPHRVISKGTTECPGTSYLDWWNDVAGDA